MFLAVLLGCILLFAFLVAVLLFGDSPSYRNTPIHKLHASLSRSQAQVSGFLGSSPRLFAILRWLVPCFYCVVVTFCITRFFQNVYPMLLPGFGHNSFIAFSIGAVAATTVLVTFSDPGTVTLSNVDTACAHFRMNGLIFFPRKCSTCRTEKPARSKHCSVCNKCVLLYDHHCIWVNNCIGYRNYRWFVAFLGANINLMAYGGYLCWLGLSQQPHPQGYWRLIVSSTESNKIAGVLAILCVIFVPITSVFAALHVRYLYLGVTSNEADKWGDVEHLVALGVLFYVDELHQYVERATVKEGSAFTNVYVQLSDDKILFTEKDVPRYTLSKVELVETDLVNIYDKGFAQNAVERLLPGSLI